MIATNVARDKYHCNGMNIGEAYKQLSLLLQAIYSPREARAIANLIIENITGFRGSERIIHQQENINAKQEETLQQMTVALLNHKPIQYVLHEAHWYKMKWYVDEHVLIPRPETEELVDWIIKDVQYKMNGVGTTILDVGTGSGCIAVAIKKNLPNVNMYAADVSEETLNVAKHNAVVQEKEIQFIKMNALDKEDWKALPLLDCIISNPPYVTQSEASFMNDNVLKFEPHLALFVPDENPLIFYDVISSMGLQYLKNGGRLFFEINESFGNEVSELLSNKGYQNIELKNDLQGKNRMIKAEKY